MTWRRQVLAKISSSLIAVGVTLWMLPNSNTDLFNISAEQSELDPGVEISAFPNLRKDSKGESRAVNESNNVV